MKDINDINISPLFRTI